MKGKLQREIPWLHWTWCYAHRLELACKDGCSSQVFKDLTEMLLRVYYLYAKSPKKSCELTDLVYILEGVWEIPEGGDLPIRSQGTRWIDHKRKALQRLVDRFSAYLSHIVALSGDPKMKNANKARLKGYFRKWKQAKMLIGAAMYIDLLKAPALFSLCLQDKKLDIVRGIRHLLQSSKHRALLAKVHLSGLLSNRFAA